MNIFLLGNGFDLYHKLPTKYINFLNTMEFLRNYYDEKSVTTAGDVFSDYRLTDKEIQESYSVYKSAYDNIKLNVNEIKWLIEEANKNPWYNYFINNVEDGTWIDFEQEIGKVISAFETIFEQKEKINYREYGVEQKILECFKCFFDNTRGRLFFRDTYVTHYVFDNIYKEEKIIGDLYNYLLGISKMLKTYLSIFIEALFEGDDNSKYALQKLSFIKRGFAFTFNYTNLCEKIYGLSNDKVCHIHGLLEKDIILGVNPDDKDKIESINTRFLAFKKYYQRVYHNTEREFLILKEKIKDEMEFSNIDLIDSSCSVPIILYVVGHSLDKSDEDVIKKLVDMVTDVIVYCYNDKDVATHIRNLINIYGKEKFEELYIDKHIEFKIL